MFDVGFWEMAFIGVIALVVIGPERLPGVARNVGMWVGKARRMINEVKSDVKREMKEYDMEQVKAFKSELDEASKNLKDVTKSTTESLGLKEATDDFKNSVEGVSDSLKQETSAINQSVRKKAAPKTAAGKKTARKKTAKKKTTSSKKTPRKTAAKATTRKVTKKPATKRTTVIKTAAKKPATNKTVEKRIATAAPARKKANSKKTIAKKAARKPVAPVLKIVPKPKK